MNVADALLTLRQTRSLVFTTREFAALGGITITFASQMLRRLAARKHLSRLYRGLWADTANPDFNAYKVIPLLTRPHPAAVSLLTALHLHGMIEQIPQMIYVVSTAMTRKVHTPVGTYSIHKISPDFFQGYDYYREKGDFLIASPEKALVDCLYLSARKKKRFLFFPEMSFPKGFRKKRAFDWVDKIPYDKIRVSVRRRLEEIFLQIPARTLAITE